MRRQYAGKITELPNGESMNYHCIQAVTYSWDLRDDPNGKPLIRGNAIDVWKQTPNAHKYVPGDLNSNQKYADPSKAPVGAIHWWKGGKEGYGHVTIQDIENQYVWGTDAPTKNQIGIVPGSYIQYWSSNLSYIGWSDYLGKYKLPIGTTPAPTTI